MAEVLYADTGTGMVTNRPKSEEASMVKVLYKTTVTAHGGREGRVTSADGAIDLKLAMPKALGGPGGVAANPETLFAAGYAACFESALRLLASNAKKPLKDASVTATVGIGPRDAGGFGLTVDLAVKGEGLPRAELEELAKAAHETVCPYSHATRGNVDVTVRVE
jgi:Ohr subfamily peroxiredoxin